MDAYASKGQFDVTQILWKNQEKNLRVMPKQA